MEHALENVAYVYLNIGGKKIPFITDTVVAMWIVMLVIIVAAVILTRRIKTVPAGAQSLGETVLDFMNNFSKEQIGHHGSTYMPYLTTLLIFIGTSNLIGIVNFIPSGGVLAKIFGNPGLEHFEFSLHPPTRSFNVTLAFALMSIGVVVFSEFKYRGFKGWLRGFYKPNPIFGFIKVLDYFARPVSLCFRLFGNIVGGTIVMTLIYSAAPWIVPNLPGFYFDLFDGCLQAYVFVFLTSLYIGEAVEEEEVE